MKQIQTIKALTTVCVLSTLVACGGGGGTPNASDSKSNFTPTELQGRWVTTAGITPTQTAIVVPTSNGSMSLWLLGSDLQSLAKLNVSTSGTDTVTAQGKVYALANSSSTPQAVNYNGTANLSNNTLSLNSGALQLNRTDNLSANANLADVVGTWSSSSEQTVKLTLSITNQGNLSGSTTTGCTYSGLLTPNNGVQVFGASLSETCTGSKVDFYGVATYRLAQNNTPAGLTLTLVNTTESSALVMMLGKN